MRTPSPGSGTQSSTSSAGTAVLRRRPEWVLPAGIALIAVSSAVLWPGADHPLRTLDLGPYLPIFFAGSLAAFVHWWIDARGGIRSRDLRAALELTALVCLAGVLAMVPSAWRALSGDDVSNQHFHKDYWLFGLLWSVFLLAVLHGAGPLRALLATRVLRFVGVVSFSVYLWHVQVLRLCARNLGLDRTLEAWLMIAGSLAVAAVSYALVERPFLRLGARFGRAPRPARPGQATAET